MGQFIGHQLLSLTFDFDFDSLSLSRRYRARYRKKEKLTKLPSSLRPLPFPFPVPLETTAPSISLPNQPHMPLPSQTVKALTVDSRGEREGVREWKMVL